MKKAILYYCVIFLYSFNANAQWQRSNGPYGGYMIDMVENNAGLYASALEAGIFFSSDLGLSWIPVNNGLTNLDVKCMLSKGDSLFAGTSDGVFISINNAMSWTLSNNGWGAYNPVFSLGTDGANIFAGTLFGLYVSSNNGVSWSYVNIGSGANTIFSIASVGNYLFVGTDTSGLFVSSDHGITWAPADSGLSNLGIVEIVSIDSVVFVTTRWGVFNSHTNGNFWTLAGAGLPCPAGNHLAVKGDAIYSGNGGVLSVSHDFGATWTMCSVNAALFNKIFISGNIIYMISPAGIYRSLDNGMTFTSANIGIIASNVYGLAADGNTVYAGTFGGGVFESTDNGENWTDLNSNLEDLFVTVIAKRGADLFAGTAHEGVFVSHNNGASWNSAYSGFAGPYVSDIAFIGNEIYASTWDQGILKSIDNGLTWNASNNGLTQSFFYSVETLDTVLFAGSYFGLFRSTDHGNNWYLVMNGLPDSAAFGFAIIDSTIFAASETGISKSSDYGSSWTDASIVSASSTTFLLHSDGQNVYANTSADGIFMSSDKGSSWIQYSAGLTNSMIMSFSSNSSRIFAGGRDFGGGVWYRQGSGNTAVPFSDKIDAGISIFPNPFSKSTAISYNLERTLPVTIEIYNRLGEKIDVLLEEENQYAGKHLINWNGSQAGVYFVRVKMGETFSIRKLVKE